MLHVATIDHGLRPRAAAEAKLVASAAADLGLPHTILTWDGPKPTSRLQERARDARYALLVEHAGRIGASHILTAHHADDQAETVLFRLGRGSGIGGLAGMRRVTPLTPALQLVRPLLGLTKAELVAFCRANAIAYVEDPSNHDPAFARARLREHAALLSQFGLDAPGLNRLARRTARADDALEMETERLETLLSPAKDAEAYRVDLGPVRDTAPELALRLLSRGVVHVAGESRAIRLERLETLAEAVWSALQMGTAHRSTLAGTCIKLHAGGRLDITREPRRRRGVSPRKDMPVRPD